MLIVPLKGDKLTITDGVELVVESYTNFKVEPAVYVDVPRGQNSIVYFQDIEQINGVKVEYNKSSKVFTALGVVKRKYNLPQPKDTITVNRPGGPDDEGTIDVQVKTPKLHNRGIGLTKGLVIIDSDDNVYVLSDVLAIDREVGSEHFDRSKFLSYYKSYAGRSGE